MKKTILFLIIFFYSLNYLNSQSMTYSKYEEDMVFYASNGWSYSAKYDSIKYAEEVLDSCWKFLDAYPKSFARGNVLSNMLEITLFATKDLNKINPLIDSVLLYDNLPATRLRMGEILIENNLDMEQGRDYVIESFLKLSVKHHKFRAYMLMANSDISLGNYSSAELNYEKALALEPERIHAWYDYLGFATIYELSNKKKYIESKINELEHKADKKYLDYSVNGPNISKNISKLSFYDIDSNKVELNDYLGKVIVINKFNFWCGFCIKKFPALRKMIKSYREVEFLFINFGETEKELKEIYFLKPQFKFLAEQKVLIGNSQFTDKIYGNYVPHTLVIDKKGTVRYEYRGYKKNLEKMLNDNIKKLQVD